MRRRPHVPQPPQRELDFRAPGERRGGKRAGAGRPKSGRKVGVVHATRPLHNARHPLHITMRVAPGLPRFRTEAIWRCVTYAMAITVRRADFRICHISIQGNHLHLIVEAESKLALSRGMQGFTISLAKQVNQTLGRSGRVLGDRYHANPLTNPTQLRRAVVYVLNNWRKHERVTRLRHDPYSSAALFPGWVDAPPVTSTGRFPIARPHTWLLTSGWRRATGDPPSPYRL